MMTSWYALTLRRGALVAVLAASLAVLLPTAASPAKKDAVVSWIPSTPPEGAVLGVAAKTQLSVQIAANTLTRAATVGINSSSGSPQGATLRSTDGNPAKATFRWTPTAAQVGEFKVTFTATGTAPLVNVQRTIVIRVGRANQPPPGASSFPGVYPKQFLLSDRATESYKWAFVRHRTVARSGPSRRARQLSTITFRTPELYRNAIQVLGGVQYRNRDTWVRIRLSMLPNSSTGWVRRGSLGAFQKIHTRLFINQGALRATLYRYGKPIFKTIIGVGQPRFPTPRGEFYIREKLSGYYAPAYGPRAFGLNARSAVLTDWPGGGFVGIHGTNQPGILPGRVSHGCVRMRNPAILRLFRLMPIGTPVTIR
jgi:hypothetical protein